MIDRTQRIPATVVQVWDKIFLEYLAIIKNPEVDYLATLQSDIEKIKAKIFVVNASLFVLYQDRKEELVEVLGNNGYVVKDGVEFIDSLERISKQVKALKLQLDMKSRELEEMRLQHGKTKVNEEYFTKALVYMSKYQGYHINPKDITVMEFVEMQNMAKQEAEWQTKK